ncbi:MAG TPA: methyltransferase domain-containing protein [Puia sp.]|nr:methyltransferase domain-containing protein [Puia sp.]
MTRFSKRSCEKELLDQESIPFADIERNMRELDVINTWLGGHRISILGLKKLLGGRRRIRICEIGCGGGDNLRVLDRYCRRHGVEAEVIGVDHNAHCIAVAREKWKGGNAEWLHSDYRAVQFDRKKPDIIFSSLFCHHFTDEELVFMLRWMERNAAAGWYINDLHRHPAAYHAIRWITRSLSRSYLVRNDAPLSVLRGFTRDEWMAIIKEAGIGEYRLQWKWAFRWLLYRSTGLTVLYAAG